MDLETRHDGTNSRVDSVAQELRIVNRLVASTLSIANIGHLFNPQRVCERKLPDVIHCSRLVVVRSPLYRYASHTPSSYVLTSPWVTLTACDNLKIGQPTAKLDR